MKKIKIAMAFAILVTIAIKIVSLTFGLFPETIIPFSFIAIILVSSFFSALFDTAKANRIAKRKREKERLEAIRQKQEEEYNRLVAYNQMISTKK